MCIVIGALAVLCTLTAPARAGEQPALPLQLDQLIQTALSDNPALRALRSRMDADAAKVPQAGSLPDPQVGVMVSGLQTSGAQLTAKQMFPGPGKLRLMKQVASLDAERTVTDYTEKTRDVVAQVKAVYYDLYFIDKATEIALANKSLLADFVKIAETKYSTGMGLQQDVLRAQLAQSRILDDLLMLRQQRAAAEARLNALLNRSPNAPVGPVASFDHHRVASTESQLQEIALANRAMLQGMQLMTQAAQAEQALARRDLAPDYEVQASVTPVTMNQGMGGATGQWSVGLMLTLPLYHRTKQDKAIEQRGHEVASAQSDYEAQKTMVFSMIKDEMSMLERADRQIELYRTGIIPQAQLSLQSARAGYVVNKVDFLTLLDSQMSLYDDLRDYYGALADSEKTLAALERTVGAPPAVTVAPAEPPPAEKPAPVVHPSSGSPKTPVAGAAPAPDTTKSVSKAPQTGARASAKSGHAASRKPRGRRARSAAKVKK
jgi:outer membrane protein TolC